MLEAVLHRLPRHDQLQVWLHAPALPQFEEAQRSCISAQDAFRLALFLAFFAAPGRGISFVGFTLNKPITAVLLPSASISCSSISKRQRCNMTTHGASTRPTYQKVGMQML